MTNPMLFDSVWRDQQKYEDAEALYQRYLAGTKGSSAKVTSSLVNEIAQTRQQIQKVLKSDGCGSSSTPSKPSSGGGGGEGPVLARIQTLEKENTELRKVAEDLKSMVKTLESRIAALELGSGVSAPKSAPAPPKAEESDDDDDDIDLFGSDDDEEVEALKQQRLKEYAERKAKKPAIIAKSNIILDVKPWDDETDMKELENQVRSITMDGLVWGASKLVPLAYGIKKLQIMCVVEDEKVGTDDLEDKITAFEDYVQSMDIAAFNKI